MQVYQNWSRIVETGAPLPAATVSVYDSGTLVLSPIYEADGVTPLGNPFTSDLVTGIFQFAADDGLYDVTIEKTDYTSYTLPKVSLLSALASAPVTQSGSVTVGHLAQFSADHEIEDGGAPLAFGTTAGTMTEGNDARLLKYISKTLTNAQIKALPTVPIELLPAPPTGYYYKLITVTFRRDTTAGAYTGINTTYAVLGLGAPDMASGWWVCNPLPNDAGPGPTVLTTFLGTAAEGVADVGVPAQFVLPADWVGISNYPGIVDRRRAINISIDNNGSGNLGGGHASNFLIVSASYFLEATGT